MGAHIRENQFPVTTGPRNFCFDLNKDVNISLKHQIYSIVKFKEHLAEDTIKNMVSQILFKYKHGNDIYEHGKQ